VIRENLVIDFQKIANFRPKKVSTPGILSGVDPLMMAKEEKLLNKAAHSSMEVTPESVMAEREQSIS